MNTYVVLGNYSAGALGDISAERKAKVTQIIEKVLVRLTVFMPC